MQKNSNTERVILKHYIKKNMKLFVNYCKNIYSYLHLFILLVYYVLS